MNAWKLDPSQLYLLEGDDTVRGLMSQLRVPNLFENVGPEHNHVFVPFDNHPTHWVIIHLYQGLPDYSPNHAVHRLVKKADPNGLLFMAIPKRSASLDKIEKDLIEEGFPPGGSFSQFPDK